MRIGRASPSSALPAATGFLGERAHASTVLRGGFFSSALAQHIPVTILPEQSCVGVEAAPAGRRTSVFPRTISLYERSVRRLDSTSRRRLNTMTAASI